MMNTKQSVIALEKAIKNNAGDEVKHIAHRMYPMFMQIQANEISHLLQKLEIQNTLAQKSDMLFKELKLKIETLFITLEKDVLTVT